MNNYVHRVLVKDNKTQKGIPVNDAKTESTQRQNAIELNK